MKFTLEIELENEAMQSLEDVMDALYRLSRYRREWPECHASVGHNGLISDVNGNTVGKWEITDDQSANVTLAGTKRLS